MKNRKTDSIKGLFNIVEMGAWDEDYLHEEEQAFIEFLPSDRGEFHFGYCQGEMDCRKTVRDGKPCVEFSWEGNEEMTQVNGRGWAIFEGDRLTGMLYFPLNELELQLVARFADFKTPLQAKLESKQGPFSFLEVASILMCLAVAIMDGKPEDRSKLLRISKKLSALLRVEWLRPKQVA